MKRGPLKLKPQASQNWPVLGVPQRGQGAAADSGPGGTVPAAEDGALTGEDAPVAATLASLRF